MTFAQEPAELGNQFHDDRVLRSFLQRVLAEDSLTAATPDLEALGAHAALAWQRERERSRSEPVLTHWDSQGRRIDRIELTPTWLESRALAVRYGLVADGHDARLGDLARVQQFAKVYLHHVASAFFTCPLAMTDGAATCLIAANNQRLCERAVPHYLSRDPDTFWISGQWMTETPGGSDVSRSETMARQDGHGEWRLYGRKWFTSAAQADTALALARPEPGEAGAAGLALFYLEPRDEHGAWREVQIHRLKPKLGTRELPSAETELLGLRGEPIAGLSHGVRAIAPMLNVTRCWNAVCAIATMRRGIALARDYARRRHAFSKALIDHRLHQETLADLQAPFEAAFHLVFHIARLLGQSAGTQSADAALLRLLTPLAKLWTGKLAVSISSEVLECFGGAGYIEDTGLPQLLRDAQVLPIWEGTTNVLALDVVRVLRQTDALAAWQRAVQQLLDPVQASELQSAVSVLRNESTRLLAQLSASTDAHALEASARPIAFALARTFAGAALAQHADWSLRHQGDASAAAALRRFVASLSPLAWATDGHDAALLARGGE